VKRRTGASPDVAQPVVSDETRGFRPDGAEEEFFACVIAVACCYALVEFLETLTERTTPPPRRGGS